MDYINRTPGQLAQEILRLTAIYEQLSDELANILTIKDVNWSLYRDTVTSDKQADRLWYKTQYGAREQKILLELKKNKQIISSIKTYLRIKENEARNLY